MSHHWLCTGQHTSGTRLVPSARAALPGLHTWRPATSTNPIMTTRTWIWDNARCYRSQIIVWVSLNRLIMPRHWTVTLRLPGILAVVVVWFLYYWSVMWRNITEHLGNKCNLNILKWFSSWCCSGNRSFIVFDLMSCCSVYVDECARQNRDAGNKLCLTFKLLIMCQSKPPLSPPLFVLNL